MNTKTFISVVAGVLVLGAVIGGSFIGGLLIGKSQEAEAAVSVAPVSQPPGAAQRTSDQTDGQSLGQLRDRIQSGEVSQEDLAQLRQQFQGQFGGGGPGGGFTGGTRFGGGAGLTGPIEKVEGNTVTVNTAQGPLEATVTSDTVIRQFAQVTINELLAGMEVTVVGAPGEDGAVEAITIVVVPEGQGDLASGGGAFGGRRQPGQQVP